MEYAPPTSDEIAKNVKGLLNDAASDMKRAKEVMDAAVTAVTNAVTAGVVLPTLIDAELQAELTTIQTSQDGIIIFLEEQAAEVS